MSIESPHIFITGDMGPALPPPFGGIMKRTLLHAKDWRERGATITVQVYAGKKTYDDLGADAEYLYDFPAAPRIMAKISFILKNLLRAPFLFVRLFVAEARVGQVSEWPHMLYAAARGVTADAYFRKRRPDAVVAETASFQSYVASIIARRHGIPLILIHSAEIMCNPESGPLWRSELAAADRIISTSMHCAKGPHAFSSQEGKMHLVYSGVNFELFSNPPKEEKTAVLGHFGLPAGKFVILSIGSLHPRKGHDQLFSAILALPEEARRKMHVVLCGTGSAAAMREKARELGFPEASLTILEKLPEEEMARLYGAADAFCFPSVSDRECMGLALKEALSAGLPVIAYRSGGIPEAVEGGVNGFLAEPNDISGLSKAILALRALTPAERAHMKEVSQRKAQALFDVRRTSEQVYRIVQDAIAASLRNPESSRGVYLDTEHA